MTSGGVGSRPDPTPLTARAIAYLSRGPADVVDLIGHVCNLPSAPRVVAEHMAEAMFAGRPEFVRDLMGRWSLTSPREELMRRGARSAGALAGEPDNRRQREARSSTQPLQDVSWVVVDVETTGGNSGNDRITEVAAVVLRAGEIAEVFETLVNPMRPISRFVSRLTRITWEMVRGAPTFSAVAPDLLRALEGNVFVAHNAAFDWKMVSDEVTRTSGARLHGTRICTVRLARSLLPQLPRRSLDNIAHYYGVEISPRHRARGDALATARCFLRLLDAAADRGCVTLGDLERLARGGKRGRKKRRGRNALPRPADNDTMA